MEKSKPIRIDLGKKSFTIKHPGAFRREAEKRGLTTKRFAGQILANPERYSALLVRRARSAKGLMAMGKD